MVLLNPKQKVLFLNRNISLFIKFKLLMNHLKENFEAACQIKEDVFVVPFAYRVHAHKLGIVNTGYLVKTNKSTQDQDWIELGRRSPQLPQMFYPITNKSITIEKDDTIVLRCTMFNSKNQTVFVG